MVDLAELLRRPEVKMLELKRGLSSPAGVLRTVVAFANVAGGTLLIGLEDGTRQVRGIAEPLDLEERLASLIADSVEPRLVPDLEVIPWRKTHVVAVQVHPSGNRPHHLRREGPAGGTYVRVLLFGIERLRHFSDAWIQVGRFAGKASATRKLFEGV